jgi:hypothetical protein
MSEIACLFFFIIVPVVLLCWSRIFCSVLVMGIVTMEMISVLPSLYSSLTVSGKWLFRWVGKGSLCCVWLGCAPFRVSEAQFLVCLQIQCAKLKWLNGYAVRLCRDKCCVIVLNLNSQEPKYAPSVVLSPDTLSNPHPDLIHHAATFFGTSTSSTLTLPPQSG